MKKSLPIILLLIFSISIFGQVKTAEGKRFDAINKQLADLTRQRIEAETELSDLRTKFTEGHPQVQAAKTKLDKIRKAELDLDFEKRSLLSKQLKDSLPNNQIELLKMIVTQNEKIIELLINLNLKPN